jgi:hypothetical protein
MLALNFHKLRRTMIQLQSIRALALTVTLLSAFLPSFARCAEAECAKFLLALHQEFDVEGISDIHGEFLHMKEPTIALDKMVSGQHGGQLLVLKKIGDGWGSQASTIGYDPQGDPRWFIDIVGPEAAAYFGYKVLADDQVTVPDLKELQGAMERVNTRLKNDGEEPIAASFYLQDKVSVSGYVNAFADKIAFPMAPEGNHLFHDLSFHSSAIFMPGYIWKQKAFRIRFYQSFFQFIREKYKDSQQMLAAAKYYEYMMNWITSGSLDNGSALIASWLAHFLKRTDRSQIYAERAFGTIVEFLFPFRNSAVDELRTYLQELEGHARPQFIDPIKVEFHMNNFPKFQLLQDYEDFVKSYKPPEGFDQNAIFFARDSDDEACLAISRRRSAIAGAARGLQRQK